ncbi:HupE/UreJ family protein [Microbulbifer sp. PSTR4-B]|uniref:HupE/UreJ family protein n=1 Tax=unclassified Microbulbifer TaxID=2619833 RepID=UPI00403B33AE
MHNSLKTVFGLMALIAGMVISMPLFAHGVDDATKTFLAGNEGVSIIPFLYIGAKHMVTGYDHLLFLVGVIFFLYRSKDVLIYVSFFTLGHSLTLLFGVLNDTHVNAYLIDAIIGLSIVYKGFDNLGGFKRVFGFQPNTKAAVLIFGLFHGFGLATKLQEFKLSSDGLVENILAFNVGVEIGQFFALLFILLAINYWRRFDSFLRFSTMTNTLLMSGGLMLVGYQMTGYFVGS